MPPLGGIFCGQISQVRYNRFMNKNLLIISTLLLIFIGFLNFLGSKVGWYSLLPWFDIVMHFLGGVWVALLTTAFFYKRLCRIAAQRQYLNAGRFIILATLLVALLWEGWEFGIQGIAKVHGLFATPADSVSDIIFGLLGAMLVVLLVRKQIKKHG